MYICINKQTMENKTFIDALKTLGIESYANRIINSNSHGELFHLQQYFTFAEIFKNDKEWFMAFFEVCIDCSKEWERPESVFQHIDKMLLQYIEKNK